jgi:hypothetical protein
MARTTTEHRRAIFDYVQRRLERDCKMRGEATRIVKATGFSPSTITKVKDGERNAGDDFIHAIREYWGFSYDELERVALGVDSEGQIQPSAGVGGTENGEVHPNLRETLDWLRSQNYLYPAEFLDEYERQARRQPHDPPRPIIMADLQARYWHWCRQQTVPRMTPAMSGSAPVEPGRGHGERSGISEGQGRAKRRADTGGNRRGTAKG